jgi:glycosyltransferase involved in cell wall biosynthesis
MFAWAFPPRAGPDVIRTLKQVKYLSSEGLESVVVAGPARQRGLPTDATLSRDVPAGSVVVRAREIPLHYAVWSLDALLRRARVPIRPLSEALWPDADVGWLAASVAQGLRAARGAGVGVLYSTAGRMTAHLAALIVHRLTGLPWVADFHDSWALHPTYPVQWRASSYPRLVRAGAALERRVVAEASRTTVACESISLVGMSPGDPRRVVIYNGVDPDDLESASSNSRMPEPRRLRLSHVGSLREWRDPTPVLAAIRDLIEQGRIDRTRFELRVVGDVDLSRRRFDSLPVTFTGHVPHQLALAEMMSASALLLYQPADVPGVTSKVYEYLACGRQVLCVAHPENHAYRLVQELGGGWCADVRDPAEVRGALEQMVCDWRRGGLAPDPSVRDEVLRRFSHPRLAADLAVVLREATDGHRAGTLSTFGRP